MSQQSDVHAINRHKQGKPEHSQNSFNRQPTLHKQPPTTNNKCMFCGNNLHPRSKCPAKDTVCHFCHKTGHFAKVCMKKKKVHEVPAELTDDTHTVADDVLFLGPINSSAINNSNISSVACKQKALLDILITSTQKGKKTRVTCKIDSGAETNILPKSFYDQLQPSKPELCESNVKLSAYGGTNIPTVGSCDIFVQGPKDNQPQLITTEVVNVDGPAIIGNVTGNCIGCFPGPTYHIELEPDITPVQHPPEQVPVHLQCAYHAELACLADLGILKEVKNEYTPWVSSTVVTRNPNGSICVCLDPCDLNQAVKCNRHYVRSFDDVIPKVAGSTHFSIVDARSGYWQVKLDQPSSKLCTFNTPWGKYRWTRLPFGLTCSGDVFQEKMDSVFGNLNGVSGIAEDTFVFGKGESSHEDHIINVLDKARESNVKFNPEMFQFKVDEASFFGLKWMPGGLKADEKKIQAIVEMQAPEDLKELQSFMGMMNYLNRFSPVLAQVSQPICNLMKSDTPYIWDTEQQQAFSLNKSIISKPPLLCYCNPEAESVIKCDASMSGLGCVLLQNDKPVSYASRSLTDAEKRYSNIERELLAAIWSL
eukprot:gene13264-14631_t